MLMVKEVEYPAISDSHIIYTTKKTPRFIPYQGVLLSYLHNLLAVLLQLPAQLIGCPANLPARPACRPANLPATCPTSYYITCLTTRGSLPTAMPTAGHDNAMILHSTHMLSQQI
jgi:hypothetical protein